VAERDLPILGLNRPFPYRKDTDPADDEVLTYDEVDERYGPEEGGSGSGDHGELEGLADDDHPQYTTDAEATVIADVLAEQAQADAEAAAASYTVSSIGTHTSDPDAHGNFLTEVEADSLYDALGAAAAAEGNAISTSEAYTDDERDDHEADFDHTSLHARSHAINSGSDHTGTLDDAQIPASITRDAEAAAAYAALAHTHTDKTGRFGTGRDGAVVLDGTNQYPWATLSGSTYTMTSDVHATTFSLSNAITLRPLGCAIYAQTSITVTGTIEWDGLNASANTAGAQEGAGNGSRCTATKAGAAGLVNTDTAGNAGAAGYTNQGSSPGLGGAGGVGGTNRIGGSGGDLSVPVPSAGGVTQWDNGVTSSWMGNASVTTGPAGGSGGGGGAGAASGTSGGGGAGGGVLILIGRTITVDASGIISARGGNGGNASGTGPVGGGGGGGGGTIYLEYYTYTNNGTVRVDGGTGGTPSGTLALTSLTVPSNATLTSDTDAAQVQATLNISPTSKSFQLIAVMSTKSGGGDVPTSVKFTTQNTGGEPFAWENATITQIATVVNGDQRLTLYWMRWVGSSNHGRVNVVFPATQTSVSVDSVGVGGNVLSANAIQQSNTNTATGTTCVVTLGVTPSNQSYTFGFFAVQANVAMTAGTGFTANTTHAHAAPAGQMRSEFQRGGTDPTVDMTTAASQTWVGIAVEVRGTGAGEQGYKGRIVQIPHL
jgi:hypothetical protein